MASHLKTKFARSLDYSLLFCIRGYRYVLSYLLGPVCRFQPSCSSYALTAIQVHGSYKGLKLACMRILRCHPWHPGGIDEVPTPTLNLTDRS